jgi:hypothetical protein
MSFPTIFLIVSFLGATIGVKKPWMGGIPGLLIAPFLFYFSIASNIILTVITMLFLSLLGLACGCVCSIIFSGLSGRGHNVGPTIMGGFGVHHPGGLILSDKERKMLKDENIKRALIISY